MNTSDKMIAAATIAAVNARIGDKSAETIKDITRISILGKECMTIDRVDKTVTLYGQTVCSRKSTRLMNTVLKAVTTATVKNNAGRWFLKRMPDGNWEEFTGTEATVDAKNESML